MRRIWPFYAVMFGVLMLVTYLPELPRLVLGDLAEHRYGRRSDLCFRKSTTCSRLTVGKPARNSSIDSPPSR